jgi:hypothetical protein
MLRMRKKPRPNRPNVNRGKPWSDLDLADLRQGIDAGGRVDEIADFLSRDVDEVEAKVTELLAHRNRAW